MEYTFKFDETNPNCLIIEKDGKRHTYIACPPIDSGCDILNFSDKLCNGYTFNFDGCILITTKRKRKLYYKDKLMAKIKRK